MIGVMIVGMSFPVSAAEVPRAAPGAAAPSPKEIKAKPYPLDFCLISGEKFEGSEMKPFELVHEGQTIKFCCKSCVKDFRKDPKKQLARMEDAVKKLEAAKKTK